MQLTGMTRAGNHLSAYSELGSFSTYSFRQRYTMMLKTTTDPMIADFFYEKWLHSWTDDTPSYNYWFVTSMAMGCMVAILSRHYFFNPDLYGRQQEVRKPMPDRHRQWTYSLPYYNHRLRNCVGKFRHAFIDNEPDWADNHPLGYRPNRKGIHRRPYLWVYTIPRYTIEDPLYTSCLFSSIEPMYQEIGYTKKAKTEEED